MDVAPANSPVLVAGLPLVAGSTLTFVVTGSVNNDPAPPTDPPDGDSTDPASPPAGNGIAGMTLARRR